MENKEVYYVVVAIQEFDNQVDYSVSEDLFKSREEAMEYIEEEIGGLLRYNKMYGVSAKPGEDGMSISSEDGDYWRYIIKKIDISNPD